MLHLHLLQFGPQVNTTIGVCKILSRSYIFVKFIKHNQNNYLKLDVSTCQRPSSEEAGTQFFRFLTRRQDVVSRKRSYAWLSWQLPHHGSWPVVLPFGCVRPLIHLVKRSGSLSITVAWGQLMTWFSWVAWSVRADLLCSVKLDARWLLVNVRLVLDSTSVLCSCNLTPKGVLVHPKDKQDKEDVIECVYKVPCANCDKTYIGETGRKFGVREF